MNDKYSHYVNENGEIKMCECCRRVKAVDDSDTWILDTVLYVEPPDNVIFETCNECLNK